MEFGGRRNINGQQAEYPMCNRDVSAWCPMHTAMDTPSHRFLLEFNCRGKKRTVNKRDDIVSYGEKHMRRTIAKTSWSRKSTIQCRSDVTTTRCKIQMSNGRKEPVRWNRTPYNGKATARRRNHRTVGRKKHHTLKKHSTLARCETLHGGKTTVR